MPVAYVNKMTKPLPKWEMLMYAALWNRFKKKDFTNKDAQEVLKVKDSHLISVLFYELKKQEWITISRDKNDQRKKIYKLKEPNEAVKEMKE